MTAVAGLAGGDGLGAVADGVDPVAVVVAGGAMQLPLAGADGLVDMGTGFDDFTPRSLAYATESISAAAQANRARLRDAMVAGGFTVYDGEWWHFDGPGAAVERPIPDVPID